MGCGDCVQLFMIHLMDCTTDRYNNSEFSNPRSFKKRSCCKMNKYLNEIKPTQSHEIKINPSYCLKISTDYPVQYLDGWPFLNKSM